MKFLAIEREIPDTSSTATKELLKAEAATVWELYLNGVLREHYFNLEMHTAILILECDDRKSARYFLGQLPLVQHRLIDFELIPLTPYDGFERLFEDK